MFSVPTPMAGAGVTLSMWDALSLPVISSPFELRAKDVKYRQLSQMRRCDASLCYGGRCLATFATLAQTQLTSDRCDMKGEFLSLFSGDWERRPFNQCKLAQPAEQQ